MKNILLLVHDDSGQESRLQAALDVARAVNGHLTCLDVIQPPVLAGDYVSMAGQALVLEDEREREARNRELLEQVLSCEDVPWDMQHITGDVALCVTDAAGLADLIVLNCKLDAVAALDMLSIATAVVLKSGKPIIAVSDSHRGFSTQRALIAWDGSRAAEAAMQAATPLLRLANYVQLFEIKGKGHADTVEDAAAYLSRHDIHAVVRTTNAAGRDPAELLQEACVQCAASYCVMGAYGHSPLKEAIFGGVTRTMLMSSDVPLLLAH